jgi:hypothetical protein
MEVVMKHFFYTAVFLLFLIQQLFAQTRPMSALVIKDEQSKIITPIDLEYSGSSESKKSVALAVVASLILPGMGELYAGSFESGKYNLIAEGGLWLTYGGFLTRANWLQQDAQTFASQHAGANFNNKDVQYSVNIGNFNSTDEYNQTKLRNREYKSVYTSSQYNWQWDSDVDRAQFKDLHNRSSAIKNNAKFIIAAIVVNHLFSAFSAGRKTSAYNKSLSMMDHIEIQAFTLNNGAQVDGIGVSVSTKF